MKNKNLTKKLKQGMLGLALAGASLFGGNAQAQEPVQISPRQAQERLDERINYTNEVLEQEHEGNWAYRSGQRYMDNLHRQMELEQSLPEDKRADYTQKFDNIVEKVTTYERIFPAHPLIKDVNPDKEIYDSALRDYFKATFGKPITDYFHKEVKIPEINLIPKIKRTPITFEEDSKWGIDAYSFLRKQGGKEKTVEDSKGIGFKVGYDVNDFVRVGGFAEFDSTGRIVKHNSALASGELKSQRRTYGGFADLYKDLDSNKNWEGTLGLEALSIIENAELDLTLKQNGQKVTKSDSASAKGIGAHLGVAYKPIWADEKFKVYAEVGKRWYDNEETANTLDTTTYKVGAGFKF